jgi:hypothetical protein
MGIAMNPRLTWVGVGTKIGGTLIAAGMESITGVVWNMANPNANTAVSIESARLGPGLGGGIGGCVIFIFNCPNPFLIDGIPVDDWGFSFSIGAKWSALVKMWRGAGFLNAAADIRKALKATSKLQKMITPGSAEKLKLGANYLWQTYDTVNGDSKPVIVAFDLPVGSYGVELSLSLLRGRFSILPNRLSKSNIT